MLYTIAVILAILWLLGMVGSYTLGGFIHILLVVALAMIRQLHDRLNIPYENLIKKSA